MNTSLENLTHKMQRAAVGKMVDVVLSHADKDPEKTMGQIVDLAKQFYGSSFSDETYERAKKTLSDPDSKWSKLINCVLDQTDPHVARTMALNLGYEAFFRGTKTIRENRVKYQCNIPWLILFDPTSACNMHCVGCWAGEYGHKNNIRIAKKNATREEVEAACKKAALDGFIRSLPKGYDTSVGELGGALSGGERQRIGVARAFLHDAPFLLLDEPTSNLDSLNEGVILKAVRAECRDKTVLLVSHRKSTMAAADVTYSVESGRLS